MTILISVYEVKELREERQCGLEEAKAILTGRKLHRLVDEPLSETQLREILHTLINKVYPQ